MTTSPPNHDGAPFRRSSSLWTATVDAPARRTVSGTEDVDVAVVGAGITGLMTALRCVEAGRTVAVLEMGSVGQGVTGHTTAKISSLHELVYAEIVDRLGEARAQAYADANQQAVADIGEVVQRYGIDCGFERRDAVTWTAAADRVPDLAREAETALRLGLPARLTSDVDLPFDVASAVVFADQAQFHPLQFLLGLADAVDAAGGSAVYEHARVTGLRPGSPHRVIIGSAHGGRSEQQGEIRARDVVVATHLPFFSLIGGFTKADIGAFFARTEPSRSYVVALPAEGPVPASMSISAGSPTRSLRTYSKDGETYLLVGGESHRTGESNDERQHWAALEAWARQHLDLGPVVHRWSAQDYHTVDGVPYIGRMTPVTPRLWTATGYRKWGMTNAAVASRILAAGIAGEPHPWASAFEPSRPTLRASAGSFARNQLEAGRHAVGDRIGLPGSGAIDDLEDGDGVVVRIGGRARAVCRIGDALTSVSPVCTHLGCHVAWNTAEKSWDCPCHGSRFAADGTVIQGPANRDLRPRPLSE